MARAPGPVDMIFNALLLAKRKYISLKFGEIERIELDSPWGKGNKLFDWYNGLTNHFIDTIQLRKEREPPLYHEYVTFRLRDGAGCFRIDRYPKDENVPLVGSSNDRVMARDTISRISSLEAHSPHASHCLVEIKFNNDVEVRLMLLLDICQAISRHPLARMYTFQRFSGSFHSQTVFMCLAHEYTIETATERPGPPDNHVQNLRAVPQRSTRPINSADALHQNYPGTFFITHEDQCVTCWKLALFRRVTHRGGEIDSVDNVSGLFWDGVARVAGEFIRLLDTTENSRNELWFLCPRVHWMEVCRELTYQAIRGTWDTRLDLFKQNLVSLAEMPSESDCSYQSPEILPEIHRSESEIGRLPTIIKKIPSGFEGHDSEMARFFKGKIDDDEVKAEFKQRVHEVCQKSGNFHMALNKYYEAINKRMDIKFGFKFYHPSTNVIIDALARISSQPDYKRDLAEHLHIPREFMTQSQLKYASKWSKHDMEELQQYLVLLLYGRGIRLEQYKDQLDCDATTVVRDITNTRKDIWNAILQGSQS